MHTVISPQTVDWNSGRAPHVAVATPVNAAPDGLMKVPCDVGLDGVEAKRPHARHSVPPVRARDAEVVQLAADHLDALPVAPKCVRAHDKGALAAEVTRCAARRYHRHRPRERQRRLCAPRGEQQAASLPYCHSSSVERLACKVRANSCRIINDFTPKQGRAMRGMREPVEMANLCEMASAASVAV